VLLAQRAGFEAQRWRGKADVTFRHGAKRQQSNLGGASSRVRIYSKCSSLQVKNDSLQINYYHSSNLQRQESYF
jgi:hypothetical protein